MSMKPKQYLVWICSILVVLSSSCETKSEIDNTGIVRTPYVLYTGGLDGTIRKSNDINYFDRINGKGGPDNTPIRQIITADTNILLLKGNCYVSDDDGRAFSVTNTNALAFYDLFYKYYLPHQMVYDESEKRVYLCVNGGLAQSDDLGKTFTSSGLGIAPKSVVELENGNIFAIQDDANIYVRNGGVGPWSQVTAGSDVLDPGSNYYLTSFGNILVATDYEGMLGCFFSTDGGANWEKYGGVSGNGRYILFVNSVKNPDGGNDLFLGRDSMGLFKLDPIANSFEASGTGLPWSAKVQYVESKKIVFRTGIERHFYFCATDVGLYLSEQESAGKDWRAIRAEKYSTLQ